MSTQVLLFQLCNILLFLLSTVLNIFFIVQMYSHFQSELMNLILIKNNGRREIESIPYDLQIK